MAITIVITITFSSTSSVFNWSDNCSHTAQVSLP